MFNNVTYITTIPFFFFKSIYRLSINILTIVIYITHYWLIYLVIKLICLKTNSHFKKYSEAYEVCFDTEITLKTQCRGPKEN